MLGLGTTINRGGFVSAADPLLLDTYSGAAAAFSLRKLSSTYSGPALQIRRASDNVEVDVSFDDNGVVSLNSAVTNVTEETSGTSPDPDSTSATTLGEFVANASYTDADSLGSTDSALVQRWYDQSGNSNGATQNTAGSQPTIVSSGVLVTENGNPAMQFDGTDDFMSGSVSLQNAVTVFLVYKRSATSYILDAISPNRLAIGNVTSGNAFQVYVSQAVSTTSKALNQQNLGFVLADTTNSFSELNGSTNGPGNSGDAANSSQIFIGSRRDGGTGHMTGVFQEIIYYNSDQSSNRTNIESNINTFYSIY